MKSIDPGTGETVWEGQESSSEEIQEAVLAARAALPEWSLLPPEERLGEFSFEGLAETISLETGKPLWESQQEVAAMEGKLALARQALEQRAGSSEKPLGDARLITRHRPLGVVGVLGPFNMPGHIPFGQIIPALLAGNCVLFKPSEKTPKTGELLRQLMPEGVFHLLQGGAEVAKELSHHPKLDGLFFTGSPEVGQQLSAHYGNHPDKLFAAEMGGNAPIVVWGCSDLDAAAYTIVLSAYITAGQRCTCARRLIIPRGEEGDAILDALMAMVTRLRVGHFRDDPEPFMGPVISNEAAERLLKLQEEMGGELLIEMTRLDDSLPYLQPGLIDMTDCERHDREIFGPLLQVIRVSNFESAIEEANRTDYGLAAAFLGDSFEQFTTFRRGVHAGVINWNRQTTGASGSAPFGGVGLSGNHRPAGYYMADSCAYPVASIEVERLEMPDEICRGIEL
jgi:succinylglutamic semialdehyde dehydrogenase